MEPRGLHSCNFLRILDTRVGAAVSAREISVSERDISVSERDISLSEILSLSLYIYIHIPYIYSISHIYSMYIENLRQR